MAAKLRVATEKDASNSSPPASLKEAAERSERALLVKMRTTLAERIDGEIPAHALAPLIRQLRDVDREIRALDLRAKEEAKEHAASADEQWDETAI